MRSGNQLPPPTRCCAVVENGCAVGTSRHRKEQNDHAAVALARIDAYRIKVLRSSSGFAATSTYWTDWNPDSPYPLPDEVPTADDPRVADITVLNTGATWVEYPNGDWPELLDRGGIGVLVEPTRQLHHMAVGVIDQSVLGVGHQRIVGSVPARHGTGLSAPQVSMSAPRRIDRPEWS